MLGHRKRRQFKQTDAFTRGMVIGLKRAGWYIRQIAADTHLGASTVHRLWRRWLEQGNVAIYRNVGATRVTSARVNRRILRQAVAAPQATCTAILQHVQDTLDHSISTRTISRRLAANGLHACRPLRRLPLTPPNRRQRLEWCRARSTWMTEWHRVVFSDESRFCLSTDSRRVRVWRRRGERSNPAAIVERPTVRQRGIMVWGAIAYDSRSPLLRIQGTMTAQRYVDDVLRPVTLPYLQGVPNALYQQDNARPHTARISQQALQDVQMLPWPPYSPDLSPIEHVWDIIGRRLHALPQPRSEDELWQMVEREWKAIPQDAIRTLIDSLPRRVAACIAVRGFLDSIQVQFQELTLHALPHPDHPASAGPSCPACGSPDGSLGHRYWSCPHIRPLVREAFNIIGRPPDLQSCIYGTGLIEDDLAILASAKSRINRYFVQVGLAQTIEDIAWRRTLSRTKHYKGMTIHQDGTRTYRTCDNCPGVELIPTHIFSCPAMAAALQKIDIDSEHQLYTPKIVDIAATLQLHPLLQPARRDPELKELPGPDHEPSTAPNKPSEHHILAFVSSIYWGQNSEADEELPNDDSEFYFGKDGVTKWKKTMWQKTQIRTRSTNIISQLPGPKSEAKSIEYESDAFTKIIDIDMVQKIVDCTNAYISNIKEHFSRERDAKLTTVTEILALFGLLIMSGIKRAAHLTYKELWAVDGSGVEIVRAIMSQDRFLFLLRCLRFDDITTRKERKKLDKLAPIREFVEAFVYNCKKLYTPGEYNTIDEKLIPFRGRCGFRQYMPNKPAKYGLKIYTISDARTFYTFNFEIYCGKQPDGPYKKSNSPDDIVKRLITPISGTSRNITTDNWYTSYKLSQDLLTEHKLTLVGTLKKNKKEIPKIFLPNRNRPKYNSIFGFTQNTTLVSYVPKKSKAVLLLSTMHSTPPIDEESGFKLKPEIVTFYNLTKGGVDMVNQMCGTYSVGRRTNRWPLCLFFDLLNVAGINSEIIFKSLNINSPRVPRRIFLKNISLQLFQDPLKIRSQLKNLPRSLHDLIILHCKKAESPEIEMSVESEPKKRKRCYVCPSTKGSMTQIICYKCRRHICQRHSSNICKDCE
ncbi:hypothetical protein LAZ67_3002151 [Cordylochernes scorpioides]|uniref:Transposase n=1 Tax=Cordylochernes scorpioides TaxID=51811 RepID=A0ABY6KAS9_9ARAC|nr:hypothetical protein LAZ67_3002151 [Cordylochernes scorpioides]